MPKATIAIYKDIIRTGRGADRATATLANALVALNYDIHFITRQKASDPFSVTFDAGVTCHWVQTPPIKSLSGFLNKLLLRTKAGASFLRRWMPKLDLMRQTSVGLQICIKRIAPDVIIAAGTNELVELTYAQPLTMPLIAMFHVYPPTCFKKNKYQRVTRLCEALKHVTLCQVLLPSFRNTLSPYTTGEVVAIGNSITFPTDAPLPPFESRKKVIVYIAYFSKEKNHSTLIDAFARLQNADDWELHLYGSGTPEWETRIRNQIAAQKLESRIKLFGVTLTPRHVFENASICAFPSHVEGFALSLIEAMWCGLPCVGFQYAPAVNEVIVPEANGLLAKGKTADDFAIPLQRLVDDAPLRERLGVYASRTVRATYTPQQIWQQWDDLIMRHLQK